MDVELAVEEGRVSGHVLDGHVGEVCFRLLHMGDFVRHEFRRLPQEVLRHGRRRMDVLLDLLVLL